MLELVKLFSNPCAPRLFGKCSTSCISCSKVYMIHIVASHFVFFKFKHWLIYCDVYCDQHQRLERWTIEKMWKKLSDIQPGLQTIQTNNIYISCCQYRVCPLKWHILRGFTYGFDFKQLIYFICTMTNNEYNLIFNNCYDFSLEIKLLSQNVLNSYF